jgi:type IV secretion system protein TrbL
VNDGTLDTIVTLFQASSFPLFARIYAPMRAVFVTLWVIHFAWDTGLALLSQSQDFWGRLVRHLVVFAFLWGLISTAPLWLWRVLDGFAFLAEDLTGLGGLSPSAVLDTGVELFFTMFTAWEGVASFLNPMGLFLRGLTAVVLLGAFAVIAAYLLRVLVEGALALGALAFFLGFLGHKYTWGLAEGYFRYLLNLGVRIFVLYLLVGVGQGLAGTWRTILETAPAFSLFTDPRIFVAIPVTAAIWATLVLHLPGGIAREITGPFSMSGMNPLGRAH